MNKMTKAEIHETITAYSALTTREICVMDVEEKEAIYFDLCAIAKEAEEISETTFAIEALLLSVEFLWPWCESRDNRERTIFNKLDELADPAEPHTWFKYLLAKEQSETRGFCDRTYAPLLRSIMDGAADAGEFRLALEAALKLRRLVTEEERVPISRWAVSLAENAGLRGLAWSWRFDLARDLLNREQAEEALFILVDLSALEASLDCSTAHDLLLATARAFRLLHRFEEAEEVLQPLLAACETIPVSRVNDTPGSFVYPVAKEYARLMASQRRYQEAVYYMEKATHAFFQIAFVTSTPLRGEVLSELKSYKEMLERDCRS